MGYETIIGLEVHAQLDTTSKMYCRCGTDYSNTKPNTHVCPVCLGMPGVLPTINKQAIEYTIMTALALNCTISDYTKFDRKNYPYPDLMKGYQISQYDAPIGYRGWLSIDTNGSEKRIGITRVHLEEDVAKLLHRTVNGKAYSLVDVNRSGVPLMEIVGDPDIGSAEEARQYLIKLRRILRYLGVSTANMEEGSFRCDANISIRPEGTKELMPKIEVKNMNSFKAVYRALEYEEERQRKTIFQGKKLTQETRGWVEDKGKTVSQRSKEFAHDYRYFPEPDLPPLLIEAKKIEEIRAKLPELPQARCDRFMSDYGLSEYDASLLTGSKAMADYFEDCLVTDDYRRLPRNKGVKQVSNWILGEVSRIINENSVDISRFGEKVAPSKLVELLVLNAEGVINTATAKSILEEMFESGRSAKEIMEDKGLSQISDSIQIEEIAVRIITANPRAVADYRSGKEQSLKFLVGQLMKETKGRANPNLAGDLLKKKLGEG
ncbi:MAG: Asp-tRNA(Asn)/Glu-tRNA(Gln) amidotransferase subunit GatB [Dehalococcoidia bacterium]|nr:MAG: Asp-tRNA(Asn)/Glu-tRNA(Gln) amidotransferase subunit GatB [Dehalococcoidia bacterium]